MAAQRLLPGIIALVLLLAAGVVAAAPVHAAQSGAPCEVETPPEDELKRVADQLSS